MLPQFVLLAVRNTSVSALSDSASDQMAMDLALGQICLNLTQPKEVGKSLQVEV